AIDMHGARAALRDAAAVLGAGQADVLADRPEQWRVPLDDDVVILSVVGLANPSRSFPVWECLPARLRSADIFSRREKSNWTSSNHQSQASDSASGERKLMRPWAGAPITSN